MRLRRPLPAVQGDTLHIVGVGVNRIGKLSRSNSQYNGEIKRPYRWNKDVIVAIGTHDLDLYRIQESFFRRKRKFYSHDVFYNLGQRTKTFPGNFIIYNKTPEELETRTREIDGTLPVLKKIKQGDRCVGQIKIKDDSIDNAFLFVAPSLPMSHQDVCLIPSPTDHDRCAHSRCPIDMIFQG